jgi:N12 class adenine-specific DNA methylase
MPGRGTAERAGHITQLGFDSLAAIVSANERSAVSTGKPASIATFGRPEVYRSAPQSRRRVKKHTSVSTVYNQSTFDDLFATTSREADIPSPTPLTSIRAARGKKQNSQYAQLGFDSLTEIPPENGSAVPTGKPAGSGTESNDADIQRSEVQTGERTTDELSGILGGSDRTISSARRRRVIFDEPEPETSISSDFRITEAHGVGLGGLHEKANTNIEAIRLLKTLEAENRDAREEEKALLVRYAGWGALAQVFEYNYHRKPEWNAVATELKQLLTEKEYESARATTPNAHFTSPLVINAIWDGLQKLGVGKNIEVLEPASGIGHFFGMMPETMQGGHRTGVELDSLTARIAQKLYPDATIFAQGFEETQLPDNYFDAVVGNVPFGDYPVHDPTMKHSLTRSIHDYFFAKSMEKVRPGGIMAFITSRYTMDKQDGTIRTALAEKADLVAAIRLPNTAFKGNAGTEVTTDILFLQKRPEGQEPAGERWTDTKIILIEDRAVALNEYYINHPDMLLGEMKLTGTMYRDKEPTLAGELTELSLRRAIHALPEDVYLPRDHVREPARAMQLTDMESFNGIKDGGYAVIEGKIVKRLGTIFEPALLSSLDTLRVRGLMQIRDSVREVFRTQLDDEPEEKITEARLNLNRVYDQFVRRHGFLSSRENVHAFSGDPDHPLLISLEQYDAEQQTATKTAVFERRTLERYKPVDHVDTASEALAISLNETDGIEWERMAALTGYSLKEMQAELDGHVYQTPIGQWETADEYLSGDVRDKLRTAQAAASINPVYSRNVEALQSVQPPDILPGDINARLGASWIPKGDIADFIAETLHIPVSDVSIGHAGEIAAWSVRLSYVANNAVSNTTTHGTKRLSASDLIEDALNMRVPTIYDTLPDDTRVLNQTETIAAREAQQKLKDRFAQWIWEEPQRTERLARLYNDTFNNIRLRTYDGSHLTFPGMNRTNLRNNDLDPHQKNAVWRILQNKNTLIGHCVGAGKTNAMAAACMELKRLGLASKPMIAVPNHLVEQWGAAFLALYPQANIFVAGKDFFTTGNREKAMARIATGNFDAVIISHRSFESLPITDETFNRFVKQEITSLEEALREAQAEKGENRSIVKALEKAKKRLEAKIKDRTRRERKDDGVTFEQLGIDRIFVDEADLYKNLGFTTKMQRIAGLPNTESNRALDMYMKTRYVAKLGGGIIFATGTPISNTMAEMYTLQRYLAPELLEKAGVAHFDAWAANFGEPVTALELSPDGGGYRMHTRFAKFVNLPELLSMFRTFADIQTADMLNLPRPEIAGGKPEVVVAQASPQLKTYVSTLVDRAQRIRSGGIDPSVDNMLKITTDGRKAALDMRLVSPETEVGHETKVSEAINNMYRIWEEGADQRLTQVAFCDISTPAPNRFNVYDEIRARLLSRGIPEKEIAYIHEADTDAKKKLLFDSVNAGRVRILLGSTEKMGAGTNVQKKLWVLHHLDAPWRPRDIEQRDGRILRQGNENEQVTIYRYVTQGSFDAYMWQTLETKQRFIQQVMSGDVTVREAEDLESGALSFAEIKAIASGNPLVMEKVRIDTEVRRLDMLRAAHLNQHYEIGRQVRELPKRIEKSREYSTGLVEDISTRDANAGNEFTMTVDGHVYSGKNAREEAGTALIQAILSSLWEDRKEQKLKQRGTYKGFAIMSSVSSREGETPYLYLRGKQTYEANLNSENALGTIASIEYTLRTLDRFAEQEQSECERMEKALVDYMEQLNRPFEHEERLHELFIQQQEVNRQLDLDKGDTQVVADDRPQENIDADTVVEPLTSRRTTHVPDRTETEQHRTETAGEYGGRR